ncbi:MAG: transcription-repair coupling factor [Bacteroidales bacterium]|nr:transcription-repair coupling factor [Bacteroidales bacterium]
MAEMLISKKATQSLQKKLQNQEEVFCSGLFLSARWAVLTQVAQKDIHLIVLPTREAAEYCSADLYNLVEGDCVFFLPESGKNVERSNYKSSLGVQRTAAVGQLLEWKEDKGKLFIVSYPAAIEEKIPSAGKLRDALFTIRVGDRLPHEQLRSRLQGEGFEKVDFVSAPGQFAMRGAVIDIFSYSTDKPYRVSFFGNEVDRLHSFDCNTQLSVQELEQADIYPDIAARDAGDGEGESLLTLFPESTTVWLDSSDMYKEAAFFGPLLSFRHVFLDLPLQRQEEADVKFNISPQPVFNKNFELLISDIRTRMESNYQVFIFGEKESQLERLRSIMLQEENATALPQFVKGKNIHAGFIDQDDRQCWYTDHEIFDRFHRVRIRRTVEKSEQLTLNDLNSFNLGDYVVHIDHGVGIFGGLVKMTDDKGRVHEVVKLMYSGGDVVFVSVHSLHKISRFRSREGEPPRINKLGSKTWSNLKSSAKSKVKDIAKELIQLYAKRRASKGFAFSADSYLQEELESSFMYEDTPDQERATKAVKEDMEDACPMDRLICGDVGFGKTEIAIRAAFKAVCDSKQVAVLVPTTILSLQHYETFKSRLANLPCTVEYVSRLRSAAQISDIKKRLKEGKIDILIGTHKILGGSFEFKDLGLLVIDEEQKFGVAAKEKLRQLKHAVDTLTLTATPIPRTLQFSLLGARDLSIIQTPPPNRIPIQTEIILFDEAEIKSIIHYELNRGGQIFFLHNKVEELPAINDILHRLVPDMRICIAHGQMESRTLEDRMLAFMRGDYDLLLCTTIIENGLDIPNANTIFVNQAQNIGLSDLHQLRGRVGRSNKKAFCYLIVPPLVSITEDGRRRLRAIEEFSDLGSGFNIAMQDLDIRGAGNLLGAEQSGFISDMGYETYQKILSEAMEELGMESGMNLRPGRESFVEDCTIETDQPAYIPDDYIDILAEKIRMYKLLDALRDDREIDRVAQQVQDRFGPLPKEVQNLLDVVKIRNLGSTMGFEKIIVKNGMQIMFFVSNPLSPFYQSKQFGNILNRVNEQPAQYKFSQDGGRLRTVSRGVDSLRTALHILKRLQ